MKPIIFLDIDGVVNTIMWGNYPTKKNGRFCASIASPQDGFVNNYQALCWLNEMYRICPYDIVISSKTWRDIPNFSEYLYNSGLNREIDIIGKTNDVKMPSSKYIRGIEIKDWIEKNNFKGKFAIIDDDSDMDDLMEFLVKCNTYYGFGALEMQKVLKKIK